MGNMLLKYQLNTPNYLHLVSNMVFRRRGTRRRMALQPIQSYKQVSVDGPASRAAATNIFHTFLTGVDNYAGPTAANKEVPTGAKVMSVLVMVCFSNLVSISALLHMHVQFQRSGMPVVTPGAVGGDPNRNTIVSTRMLFIGKEQNNNLMFLVKVPKIFQRIREADNWILEYRADAVFASATQVIYKFYR